MTTTSSSISIPVSTYGDDLEGNEEDFVEIEKDDLPSFKDVIELLRDNDAKIGLSVWYVHFFST